MLYNIVIKICVVSFFTLSYFLINFHDKLLMSFEMLIWLKYQNL